ncbi:MAG: hypothetical protein NWR66_02280, partial [Burkholderiaceae bacterium]|nr:hypothetical protein [Burkholderiaceae bacterium]
MKKFLIIIVALFLTAAGAGGFAFLQWQTASGLLAEVEQLRAETQAQGQQLEGLARLDALVSKEKQFDAAREALAGGQVLQDMEAIVRASKDPSAERLLGLGAIRLMVKGPSDPSVAEAFDRALKLADLPSRLAATCAAQAGILAAGGKVEMLSECAKLRQPAAQPQAMPTEATAGAPTAA